MISFLRSRARSFGHAFAGWGYVLRTQRNAWIHASANIIAFGVGLWVRLDRYEWALLIFAFALVWTTELINTALEAVVDLHGSQQHPLAKVSKDVGAAAVLIAAFAALVVGLLVLGPPVVDKARVLIDR